jgi:YD repeat-containing protein
LIRKGLDGRTAATCGASPSPLSLPPLPNGLTQVRNGTTTTYDYNWIEGSENRLKSETTSGVTTSYTYDANGNQTARVTGAVTEAFTYDYANRLATYTKTGRAYG